MNQTEIPHHRWLVYAVLAAAVLLAYLPALQSSFVNFDDNENIYNNPQVVNVTGWREVFANLPGIFTTPIIGNYNPLPIVTFAVEKRLYGFANPQLWHADNLILHIICVLLVFEISRLLGLELLPALVCAALFGIQPMRVESVAWLTERKDVLYGAFFLAGMHCYIRYVQGELRLKYLYLAGGFFLLALFSKIQAVVLPLVMLLIDHYLGRKFERRLLTEKVVFFLLALLFGALGVHYLNIQNTLTPVARYPFVERLCIGSITYLVYLVKSLVPFAMIPTRPFPVAFSWISYLSLAIAPLLLGTLFLFHRRIHRVVFFGLLFFTVNVMFLLQIRISGKAFLADRFTYLAYFGLFFIFAFFMQQLLHRYRRHRAGLMATVGVILLIYGGNTYNQCRIWKNSETLWTRVLEYYPNYPHALYSRAEYYAGTGQNDKAITDYGTLLAADPRQPVLFYRRGMLYFNKNDRDSLQLAVKDFTRAMELGQSDELYLASRGQAYMKLGMVEQATLDFREANRLQR